MNIFYVILALIGSCTLLHLFIDFLNFIASDTITNKTTRWIISYDKLSNDIVIHCEQLNATGRTKEKEKIDEIIFDFLEINYGHDKNFPLSYNVEYEFTDSYYNKFGVIE